MPIRNLPSKVREYVARLQPSRQPARWLGLEVGSASIKLAELEAGPSGPRLVKHLIQELPKASEGQAVDRTGWLQSALKEFQTQTVHVSLGGPEVAVRRIHVPPMSPRELPEAVKWQVKEQVPFPIQEAVLAFQVVGEVWDKDLKKQDVLVAAASRASIQELVALVEQSGGRVAGVSPTPDAVWRCVSALMPETRQGSVAVIEVGMRETVVTIAKDGHIRLVRQLAVGSANLTEALVGVVASEQGEIAVDYAKAEAYKRRYGVFADAGEGTTEDGVPLFHLASLMRPVLEHLVVELGRVFDFYKVQMEESGVGRVLLCGAAANLKQFQPFLAEGLGMIVEVFNPLQRLPERLAPLGPDQITEGGPRLAVAIGLALDRGQGLDLLSADMRRKPRANVPPQAWPSVAKGVGVAALLLYGGLQFVSGLLQWQIRGQERRWEQVAPQDTQHQQVVSEARRLDGTIEAVEQWMGQQPVWDGLLKELAELTPSAIQLEEVVVTVPQTERTTAPSLHLKGRVVAEGTLGQGSITQFLDAMERSMFFSHVRLVSSELRTGEAGASTVTVEGSLE